MIKLIQKIKDTLSILSSSKGFTLLELLVVVLIIGILASIALPQYEMAVTKAKVASILPIMRRWKDALYEYKLQHGSYCKEGVDGACEEYPDGSDLGVNWPSDWKDEDGEPCGDSIGCENGYWTLCYSNYDADEGEVKCYVEDYFEINMYQPDYSDEEFRGKIVCVAYNGSDSNNKGHKICKALGGKLIDGYDNRYKLY